MIKKEIILNNHLVTYYQEGGSDTPIIFLHGWRRDASDWHPIIHDISLNAKRYTLYAIDIPGFGSSETPKHPFTLHDYAEIVKEFITKIQNPESGIQPSIVGHSFGARIAVKLAAEHPELVQKLILIDCGETHKPNAKRTAQSALAKIVKPFFRPRFMQPLRKKIYAMIGAEDYLATPELQKTYVNIIREPLEPLFPRITAPTLIIWGEKDTTTPLSYGQKIHRAIRDSRFAVIKNAGHFPFLDQPETFLNLLKSDFNNMG